MPSMIVTIGNFNGGKKLLNYPKYTKNLDLDACVCVFKETIKINGVTQKGYKNYLLPMDIVGHNFGLGGQLCE
jgi:hypothetical protein